MTLMRAACYARYSSDLQRATSIEDQIAVARRYAEQQGWTVVPACIYTDAAVSGASIQGRRGIQALLAAAATTPPPFDVVLVDDSSRVARDLPDALHVLRLLKFFGVRAIYISQQIDSASEQAETLLTVHGLVDGLYLQEMAKKIERGLAGQLQRGFHTGGRTYGYRTVPVLDPSGKRDANGPVLVGKRLEIDEAEARIIVQVFEWYANGVGIPHIVDRLVAERVPSPRGRRWSEKHVRRISGNERYRGLQIWGQGRAEQRPGTNQRVWRPQPRDAWHVAERPELRIVSDKLWDRVAARRAEMREAFGIQPGRQNLARGRSGLYSPHLFVGFMRCGVCGQRVSIVSGGMGSPRYGCPNSWHNGMLACDNRLTVRSKIVDPILLAGLQAELQRPETVHYITDMVTATVTRFLHQKPQQRVQLIAQREAVGRKLDNLVRAVENGVGLASLQHAMTGREAELRQLDDELATLDDPPTVKLEVIPTWVREQLHDVAGVLRDAPERAKVEFQRLGVQFTLSPIRHEGHPFLRAVGTGDLDALCGVTDLPGTKRRGGPRGSSGAAGASCADLPTTGRSLPR